MLNKVKVVVASNRDMHVDRAVTVNYTCQYELNGKVRMIDSFGNYRELRGDEVGRKDATGVITGPVPMILQFSKTVMFTEFTYLDDKRDAGYAEHDENTKKIVELFFGKNPLFLVNGQAHTVGQSGDHFDVIDSNIKTMNSVNSFKDKLRAANKLADMTHEQRVDVAFYYGLHPIGKSEEALLVELGDGDNGYCLSESNLSNFLKVWVDGKNEDRDLLVTLKKAVGLNIINNKPTDGRAAYYLGNTFLGSDELGLIDWSRKNPRDFTEHVVRKVNDTDKKEEAVVKSIAVAAEGKIDSAEFEALKKQAKALIEEGFISQEANTQFMGYEKLKRAVDAALAAKRNVVV